MKNTMNQNFRSFFDVLVSFNIAHLLLLLFVFPLLLPQTLAATEKKPTGPDLHKFWDRNCSECHSHSGDFARTFLKVVDGKLQGPLHKESFQLFLHNHYLVKNQESAIYDMLLAETETPPRFKDECSSCHNRAAEFVRTSLVLKDGELHSKKDDSKTGDFLQSHQDLKSDDVAFFMTLLTRVANEVYRP
jgi:mono/diheme cytochrome c family protein